jgi:hypothetical protein
VRVKGRARKKIIFHAGDGRPRATLWYGVDF